MRNFAISREFMENNGTLYEIIRKVKESQISSVPEREAWKSHLSAEAIFRSGEWLVFVSVVPEAEIVPEQEITAEIKPAQEEQATHAENTLNTEQCTNEENSTSNG